MNSDKYFHEFSPIGQRFLSEFVSDSVRPALKFFNRRQEKLVTFSSDVDFYKADVQIVGINWHNNTDLKFVELLVDFSFTDVQLRHGVLTDLRSVNRFINQKPLLLQELNQKVVMTQGGREFNRTPLPNRINLGQVDTWGDTEVLFAGRMASMGVIGQTLKLERSA